MTTTTPTPTMDEANSTNHAPEQERATDLGEEPAGIPRDSQEEALALAADDAALAAAGVDNNEPVGAGAAVASSSHANININDDDMMDDEEIDAATDSQDNPDSDNSTAMKEDEMRTNNNNDAIPERRSSKRQRVPAPYRYSPGEGGGLASKKAKTVKSDSSAAAAATESVAVVTRKGGTKMIPPRVTTGGGGDVGAVNTDDKRQQVKPGDEVSMIKPIREWSEPKYRWIGKGIKRDTKSSSVEYAGVEIDFTSDKSSDGSTPLSPLTVRIGDVVMIYSGDAPWSGARQGNGGIASQNGNEISLYNDPASKEIGLGALDPYLGLVERLWEEVVEDESSKSSTPSSTIMMMRTRWFFKKEDLEGVSGRFVLEEGNNRENAREFILASMSAHDVVLTNQSDDNAISSILGKAKVVKVNPADQSTDRKSNEPKSSFICRYTLSLCPAKSSGEDATVKLRPCTDDSDDFKVTGNQPSNTVVDSSDAEGNDCNSVRDNNSGESNADTPFSPSAFPMSPRRIVSEGVTTVGKIRTGPDHQAIIPVQIDLHRKSSFRGMSNPPSQRIPTMVWDPAADAGNSVDEFLEEACSLLINNLNTLGLQPFHDANYIESPNTKAEAKKPREVNINALLTELHECRGDVRKAIQKVKSGPEKFMTIWNKSEKEQFDAGYRIYRESIRMIANSVDGSKTCKDAVEYQYRFKFVENFRRFMRKKREKAEEIMATVEDRMLNEALRMDERSQMDTGTDISSSDEDGVSAPALTNGTGGKLAAVPASRVGPLNNRIRTWFRTGGGGKDAVGATQQRRNLAWGFLMQVRESLGEEAYDALSKGIKSCITNQTPDTSLSDVKMIAQDIMKAHPYLLEQFLSFLPEEIRSSDVAIASES
ncbi:hypothetical protein ACHAWU_004089 [Discostella pseudostelligera]|uniref:BAH domain-containing protein n=1 Tax=Discostella pseudostelligera TaxID=259834 RepID=A0ABD3MKW7_9STRA